MNAANWTPRTLAVRTFAVFRERPWLAVPVLVADLLIFVVIHLQRALNKPLFYLFLSHKDSVLSSTRTLNLTPADFNKMVLISTPLVWASTFVVGYSYISALLGTSAILDEPDLASASPAVPTALRKNRARVFRFAFMLWPVLILMPMAITLLLQFAVPASWNLSTSGILIALAMEIVAAFIIARPVLKLLRPSGVGLPGGVSRLAVFAALATVSTQTALFFLIQSTNPLLSTLFPQPSVLGILFRDAIRSLIGASPYIFLFIALSLLAAPTETTETDPNLPKPHPLGSEISAPVAGEHSLGG